MNDQNVGPFVREKAAIDLLDRVARGFKEESLQKPDSDDGDQPRGTTQVSLIIPIMPAPGQLKPIDQFTVEAKDGSEIPINASDVVDGELITANSSEK